MASNSFEQPYCLVLGGGGTKGVYHLGVWEALKELNVPVNAFIGNSIGAIVAAFLAQKSEKQLSEIAHSITMSSLVRLSKDIDTANADKIKGHSLSYWQGVYKNVVEHRGLDTSPLRQILEKQLDETKLRKADCDFGVTTVNISDFKPKEVFIEQMEQGSLIDYVMASAAFPGFKTPRIKGKRYIDGGLYDNTPFNMATRRGYRKIILVDVTGVGMHRRPKTEGTQTVYIKSSVEMGGVFDFDPDFIEQFIQLGYLDTLRTFGELIGYEYFIEKNDFAEEQWQEIRESFDNIQDAYPTSMQHDRRIRLKTLEVCAKLFEVDRIEKYTYKSLEQAINEAIDSTRDEVKKTLETQSDHSKILSKLTDLEPLLKTFFDSKKWDNNPYYYLLLLKAFNSYPAVKLAENSLLKWSPELKILQNYIHYSKD